MVVSSLAFVDDMLDMSLTCRDTVNAHENSVAFSLKKKMNHKPKKCKSLIANKKKRDPIPTLMIQDEALENALMIKYLGDIFNFKGDNSLSLCLRFRQQEELRIPKDPHSSDQMA